MTIATDNNPKRRAGALKVPLEYMPTSAEALISLVLEAGAKKYGPFNWRKEAISISTYVGAIRRHIGAIADGEDIDPETGLPHWAHIAASCSIALDALSLGKLIDDRVAPGAGPKVLAEKAAARTPNAAPVLSPGAVAAFNRDVLKEYVARYGEHVVLETPKPVGPETLGNRYPYGARSMEEIDAYLERLENERDEP